MKIAVFHGSTREKGNTEYLAYQAVPKDKATHLYLRDYDIQPITDLRHSPEGFSDIQDDHLQLVDQMLEHDIIVFATPIYWYGMAGPLKVFIDRWSQVMRDTNYAHFREELGKKKAYFILVGGDQPTVKGLPLIQQLTYICQFYGTKVGGYVIGEARKPGAIVEDHRALEAASTLISELQ